MLTVKALLTASLLLTFMPAGQDAALFTFVQISDVHIGQNDAKAKLFTQIVQDVNALAPEPAFVIVTGDLTEDGKPAEYDEYLKIVAGLKPGIAHHACPGNHETTVGRWADFERRIGPLYHSFVHQNCLFLLTNGAKDEQKYYGEGHIDDRQLAWIKDALDGSAARAHVVMANHFPLNGVWGLYNILGVGKNGDILRKQVNDAKVTAWLGGHRHFDAYHHDGVTSHVSCGWTSGTGGGAPPGYRVYTVFSDRIESRRVPFSRDEARFKLTGLDYVLPNPRSKR